MKLKSIILIVPLLTILFVELNNAFIWNSLHIEDSIEAEYIPLKKNLKKISVLNLDNNKNIHWLNENIIRYNKRLFNVHHIEQNENKYLIYIEKNYQETEYIHLLEITKNKNQEKNNIKKIEVLKNTPPRLNYISERFLSDLEQSKISFKEDIFKTYLKINTPPPKS